MVNSCCVVGCHNRVGKKEGLRFFRLPMGDKDRLAKWVTAIRREAWVPSVHTRICSEHFSSGEVMHSLDFHNVIQSSGYYIHF